MISELLKNQRALIISGGALFALFIILSIISLFDTTQILGIDRWIKPIKFAVSIAIYLWTLAFYLNFIKDRQRAVKIISYGSIVLLTGEIILILMQTIRGTLSHFNVSTPFNSAVFAAMGTMIMINTFLIIYLLVLYFRTDIELPKSIVWGLRLGLTLFIVACFEGGYMASQTGHSVGLADGGPGLPLVNWSTIGGDLRAAHFIGMHAFQAIPLFALGLEKLRVRYSFNLTVAFSLIYFALFSFAFIEALLAKPLLAL